MGMLATLRDWFGPVQDPVIVDRAVMQPLDTRASLSGMIPGWSSGRPTWPTDSVLVLTRDGYRKCVTAFACINIIADAVAEATLRVWLDQGAGKRDEIVDHPLRQLLQRPNPTMSEAEFLVSVVRIAGIAGYCVVEKIRSARGNVVQLGILRPDYVKPILRDQKPPDWEYTVPGEKPAILAAEDAVVFTYMDSPYLEVTGDTPLRAIIREAGILNELTDVVKLTLERGGMPQIALVVDPPREGEILLDLTDEDREVIRQQFIAKYTGYHNWAGPAIIEGMRVEKISFNLNELAYTDLRDGIDLEVCRAFRVPPPVVQVMAGLETSYGQLLEQSMKLLQMYTANPLRRRLDGALTRSLLPEFETRPNADLGFDTSDVDALQEDEDQVHTRAREDLRASGLTIDEFRQTTGQVPLNNEIGRSLLIPFNMILTPVDRPLAPPPTATPPEDEPPDDPPDDDEARAYDPAAPRIVTRDGRRYVNERALSPVERRAIAQVVGAHRGAILGLAKVVEPKIAAYLDEQKARVIAALTGERAVTWFAGEEQRRLFIEHREEELATRAIEELDWQHEEDELLRILRAWLDTVGETAFAEAAALLDQEIAWDVANPYITELIDLLGREVTRVTETTRADIERVVIEALTEGTSMPDLAEKLKGLYEETYNGRSMTIARTESQLAYNVASQKAYEASGVVSEAQLHDNSQHSEDYGASDGLSCADRNGLIIPVSRISHHAAAEHPNGTMAVSPIVQPLEAES